MRGGGRGGEGEGERNGCQAADEKLCLKCQFDDAFYAYLCVFSGLCAHSDGIRHQRNISRHSWIDRGEEDPEHCQYENLHLLGFCMQTVRRISEIAALCCCVCLTWGGGYYNELQPFNTLLLPALF